MQKQANIKKTSIPGLLLIENPIHQDERGFFLEIVRMNELLEESGIDFKPVQFSHSMSLPRVIRAIHSEDMNKLVYPLTGKIFIAIVDVRPESPTFGTHEEFTFDNTEVQETHKALFLPKGMGNSICALGNEPVHYVYLVDQYWRKDIAKGIAWDDPDLNIKWPVKDPIISERDRTNPRLRELFPEKFK